MATIIHYPLCSIIFIVNKIIFHIYNNNNKKTNIINNYYYYNNYYTIESIYLNIDNIIIDAVF